jgi:hypothetical protein
LCGEKLSTIKCSVWLGQRRRRFEEVQELTRAFPVPDPVVQFAGGQVKTRDHVPDPVVTVVSSPEPDRFAAGFPGLAGTRLQFQRAELVDADYPAAGGGMVVEVEFPALRRSGGYLPPVGAGVRLSGWLWVYQAVSYSSGLE